MALESRPKIRTRRHRGFTLIEVVIVLGMLVMVLFTAYQILTNALESEKDVERLALREKVGEAIVAIIRRDLAGTFFRGMTEQLNNQVFVGIDNGIHDQIQFLTTVDPTPQEDPLEWDGFLDLRTVCAVGYFLEPSRVSRKYNDTYTLYRKEVTDFSSGLVLEAPGLNQEIYDKVKALDIKYYDGWEWRDDWNSELEILAHEEEIIAAENEQNRGQATLARVSDPLDESGELGPELPPSPVPVAVRIEISIYIGTGDTIFEVNHEPEVRTFSTTIQLLAAQRIPIQVEDQEVEGDPGLDGGEGSMAGVKTFGASPTAGPDPSRGGRGARGGRGDRGARGGRPPREAFPGAPRPGARGGRGGRMPRLDAAGGRGGARGFVPPTSSRTGGRGGTARTTTSPRRR